MGKYKDITGQKFGMLTAVYCAGKNDQNHTLWHCVCECGNEIDTTLNHLTTKNTKSCGCLQKKRVSEAAKIAHTKHGKHDTRLYKIWKNIRQRCGNSARCDYDRYGGRGIDICEEWKKNFSSFYEWALCNGYDDSLTIDRIDVDKDYTPENCRWVNMKIQCNNRSRNHYLTYQGKTQTIAQWADETKINYYTLWKRIKRGLTPEEALQK